MLSTYEATLEPNGRLHFADTAVPIFSQVQRVLVTLLPSTPTASSAIQADWQVFEGALKNSPNFNGDPLQIQQALRAEWQTN